MKYDFNQVVDRKGSSSVKWDLKKDVLPLWVADMDFHVTKEIEVALLKRVKHGVYGYSITPKAYFDAEISWWKTRHNSEIKKSWILPTIGVIPALSSSVQGIANKNDKVIVLTPVYQYFFSSVSNNEANLLYNPLLNNNGYYTIDFDLIEKQAKDPKTTMLILCNPHNPVGRVWTKEELTKLVKICLKHNIIIVSDEIHRDLTYERKHIPLIEIEGAKNITITCTAPSKTFNVAGLKTANIIIPNKALREKVGKALNNKEAIEPSIFGMDALIAAYNHGHEWLDQLLEYLKSNRDYATAYLNEHLPEAIVSPLEGTYLLWVDLKKYGINSKQAEEELITEGVFINGGYKYKNGDTHIRINLATSKDIVGKALEIINDYVLKTAKKIKD